MGRGTSGWGVREGREAGRERGSKGGGKWHLELGGFEVEERERERDGKEKGEGMGKMKQGEKGEEREIAGREERVEGNSRDRRERSNNIEIREIREMDGWMDGWMDGQRIDS